jgi:hypothetical protein
VRGFESFELPTIAQVSYLPKKKTNKLVQYKTILKLQLKSNKEGWIKSGIHLGSPTSLTQKTKKQPIKNLVD